MFGGMVRHAWQSTTRLTPHTEDTTNSQTGSVSNGLDLPSPQNTAMAWPSERRAMMQPAGDCHGSVWRGDGTGS
jgi:hypothetical protein